MTETIGIVGGGILGLAIGRELTRRRPGVRVVVFEKEDRLAAHQTGHNSGVVHAGLYYKPGSLKAELCTRGRALIRDYCAEHGLPYDECGKLVVAVDRASSAGSGRSSGPRVPTTYPACVASTAPRSPRSSRTPSAWPPCTLRTPRSPTTWRSRRGSVRRSRHAGGRILLSTAVTGIERAAAGSR